MNDDCFERVRALVAQNFEMEPAEIDAQSSAATIEGWDSLAHLMILTAVEKSFGVKLPRLESYTVQNVGELAQLVARTVARQGLSR
jgi:acyl carrier protein